VLLTIISFTWFLALAKKRVYSTSNFLLSSQGHVALITALMCRIAELKPQLQSSVHVIFIASEELPWPGVGIDEMMKRGDCEHVMGGLCARQLFVNIGAPLSQLSFRRIHSKHWLGGSV
jgi:hypothetical protein